MFRDAVTAKYKIVSVLDEKTIKRSVAMLKKNKRFENLKHSYDTVRKDLIDTLSLSQEEASSIINYAIHT